MNKIVFCGMGGVGKTTYIKRLIEDTFERRYQPTLGVEVHQYEYNNQDYTIWDIAGQEVYSSLGYDQYFNNADYVFIFFDGTCRISAKFNRWLNLIKPESQIYYVRTKSDIPQQKVPHIDNEITISTKNNINIHEIFNRIN